MKIAMILPALSNTGPTLVARDIADNIYDKVDLIDIYYFDEGPSIEFKAKTHKINLKQEIEFNKYDIIYFSILFWSLAFPHSSACRLLCGDLSSLRCGILKGCLPQFQFVRFLPSSFYHALVHGSPIGLPRRDFS